MPKQFVPLIGAQSTFQQVLGRIADPDLFARPIVITDPISASWLPNSSASAVSRPISSAGVCA
jgi:hypothetical protein